MIMSNDAQLTSSGIVKDMLCRGKPSKLHALEAAALFAAPAAVPASICAALKYWQSLRVSVPYTDMMAL